MAPIHAQAADPEWPTISVVIPVLDRAEMIGPLLESVLAQDYPADRYDVTVVDNGSVDATPLVVARYPVTLLREHAVRSSYAARNLGVSATRGEIVAFTDSDCVASPGWLRGLASRWRDEIYGAFAGEVVAHAPQGMVERFLAQRRMNHKGTLAHPYLPFATTSNVAYRRTVLERVGAFNPRLRSGGDVDLSWRMQRATGLTIAYCPDAVVAHRNRSTIRGLYRQYRTYGEAFADLERLHDDFYSRFSHRYGLPRARAAVRFVRRHTLGERPQWMRPSTRSEGFAMWVLDALVKIAFDRGIRRGRRSVSLTGSAWRSAGVGSGSRPSVPERP